MSFSRGNFMAILRKCSMVFGVILSSTLVLSGCGGGGGGGGGSATTPTSASTTVSGVVSAGPLNGSNVCAYAISGGAMGAQIGTCTTTDTAGNYSIGLGGYTGPVLFQATGGTYVDEATGTTVTLDSPLHSMLLNAAGGNASVAITPLTELAYLGASAAAGGLGTANMQSAITGVGNNFGVSDVVGTMPVDALNVPASATAAQRTYALALAGISQYLKDQPTRTTLTTALQSFDDCLAAPSSSCGTGAAGIGTRLRTSLTTFQTAHTAFSGMALPVQYFGSVSQSETVASQIVNLSYQKIANPDTDFLEEFSSLLAVIDNASNGPQQFSAYLNSVVSGTAVSSSATPSPQVMASMGIAPASLDAQSVIADIEKSKAYQAIVAFVQSVVGNVVTAGIPDPAATALSAADPEVARGMLMANYRKNLDNICYLHIGESYCDDAYSQWSSGHYAQALTTAYTGAGVPLPSYLLPPVCANGASDYPTCTPSASSFALTASRTGSGSGTVTSSPAGISCGTTCSASFASGSSVTLTAAPASGSSFTGWSGACSGTATSCVVTMNAAQSVTAAFTATCANGATNYPACTTTASAVTPASITAGAAGGCSGGQVSATFQVVAANNVSWTAQGDSPMDQATMTVSPQSGVGPGTLTVTITVAAQPPTPGFSCASTYSLSFFDNVYVDFSDGVFSNPEVLWTFTGVN
jgi:Divergent InlB B-repeat domain